MQLRGAADDATLGSLHIHLQEPDGTGDEVVEAEGRDHDARVGQEVTFVDEAAVRPDVCRVVGPSRGTIAGHGEQLDVGDPAQPQRRQQEAAILRVGFQGNDLARGPDRPGRQQRVVAQVGTDVDHRHPRRAITLEDRGEMWFVHARAKTRGHGGVGGVAEELDATDRAAHRVLLGELHGERGRCDLVLNRPEHPADRRGPSQISRAGLVDLDAQRLGKRGIQQVHQLAVGDAPLGQRAAQHVHEAIAQWLESALDDMPPAVALVVHVRQRYPRRRGAFGDGSE